jgi:predicted  nucleic acid-binding Zn-ribbon protein
MSKAFELLEVGLTTQGKPFYIPRFHTLIAAASGAGKTETGRKMVSALRALMPDLKVLIFDIKSTGRDWKGYGVDVPVYVETATDSRFLRDLIETQEKRKIDWFFYELHIACQATQTWDQVLANLRKRYNRYKDKNQMKEEKLGTLIIYMEALVSELDKGEISSRFDLSNSVTVVPLNFREDAFKQLVVYSYLTAMRRNQVKRVLVVCDEMSSLAPSQAGTGCKRIVEQYLFKQGRAAEVFGVAIDQEITGISPSVRRQCWNWILGLQTDVSAQERTVNQIPGKKLALDDISTLGVGWWWAVIRTPSNTKVEKFYLIPEGVSQEIGEKIATGKMKVEEIMQDLHITKVEENDEMYKEEAEKLRDENTGLKEKVTKVEEAKKTLQSTVDDLNDRLKDLEAFRTAMKNLFGLDSSNDQLQKEIERIKTWEEPIANLNNMVCQLQTDIRKIETELHSLPVGGTSVSIAEIDERVKQHFATLEPERIVSIDVDVRIKELVKNEAINRIVTKIQHLTDPAKKAAWWLHERKRCSIKELYNYVYDKTEVGGGRVPGTFYMTVVNPLEDAWLITNESGNIRWVLQDKLAAELKTILTNEDIEKVPKYLASLLL